MRTALPAVLALVLLPALLQLNNVCAAGHDLRVVWDLYAGPTWIRFSVDNVTYINADFDVRYYETHFTMYDGSTYYVEALCGECRILVFLDGNQVGEYENAFAQLFDFTQTSSGQQGPTHAAGYAATVTIADLEIAVSGVNRTLYINASGSIYKAPPGYDIAVIRVRIENGGSQAADMALLQLVLEDTGGALHSTASLSSLTPVSTVSTITTTTTTTTTYTTNVATVIPTTISNTTTTTTVTATITTVNTCTVVTTTTTVVNIDALNVDLFSPPPYLYPGDSAEGDVIFLLPKNVNASRLYIVLGFPHWSAYVEFAPSTPTTSTRPVLATSTQAVPGAPAKPIAVPQQDTHDLVVYMVAVAVVLLGIYIVLRALAAKR